MADKTINELTAATTMGNDDLLVLQQGGTAKKLSGKQLGDYVYNAAAEKVAEVNQAVDDARSSINDIVESVQSMTELGTDTTLTTTGMAADAKVAGDKIKEVEAAAMAGLPEETASGSIVTITDGADNIPVKKMTVGIEPVQEGTGDPSPDNIRPISGWTGAKVTRTGANVLDLADAGIGTGSSYNKNSGKISIGGSGVTISGTNPITITNTTNWRGAAFFTRPLKADSYRFRYRIKGEVNANVKTSFYEVDSDNNIVAKLYISAAVSQDENYIYHPAFTIANDGDRLAFCVESSTAQTITIYDLSVNYPDTDMDYHAYTGTTIPIIFPSEAGTVHGGKIEINEDGSGILSVTHKMFEYDGSSDETWVKTNSGDYDIRRPSDMAQATEYYFAKGFYSNWLYQPTRPSSINKAADNGYYIGSSWFAIKCSAVGTLEDWISKLQATPLQFLAPLPDNLITTYTLTTAQITTLLGANNIWADTGDITEFVYREAPVDLSYVNAKIDEIEPIIAGRETAMTATKNYSSGGLVIVNHTLYKLDANVASGETLAPNTNCHMTTVEAEIAECVPYYRSVNGKALSSDITLTAEDIPYDDTLAEHTSGSVGKAVSDLKESLTYSLYSTIDQSNNFVNRQYIALNIGVGNTVDITPVSSVQRGYVILPCKKGDKFVLTAIGAIAPRAWGFTDANYKLLSVANAGANADNLSLTATSDGYFISNHDVTKTYALSATQLLKAMSESEISSMIDNAINEHLIVDATGSGDYTSLTEALYDTVNSGKTIIVKPGTYDIHAEYIAKWGATAVDAMADSDSETFNGFQYGAIIRNRKVIFEPGSFVVCDFTYQSDGTTPQVINGSHRMCAFRMEYNAEVYGLNLIATHTFYAIHDDYGISTPYTNIYENCYVKGINLTNSNCIGGGCKKYSRHIINNCYFDNNLTGSATVRYHNTNVEGAAPEIYVNNCYFNNWFTPRWYGAQTSKMRVYVNNCHARAIYKVAESSSYDVDNVELYKWNNEETDPIT